MSIISPCIPNQDALATVSLTTLEDRRSAICISYIEKLKCLEHLLAFLLPRVEPMANWCINCVLMRVMERRERDNS